MSSSAAIPESADHLKLIKRWAWFTSDLSGSLVYLASLLLPLFDSSPRVLTSDIEPWWLYTIAHTVLRWDTIHFVHVAQHGYVYEHERAFLPGMSMLMRVLGKLLRLQAPWKSDEGDPLSMQNALLGGIWATRYLSTSTTLYRLTLHHMRSQPIALLASLLSLLPSSPPTARFAPYNEQPFAFLSYQGTFRSNGIFLAGFVIWGLLVDPFLSHQRIPSHRLAYTGFLTSMIFTPFIVHQYMAYRDFCQDPMMFAPWCSNIPPSVYTYVQARYWDSGFLRYWTPQQLPNFLICAPVLVLLFMYSLHYIRCALIPRLRPSLSSQSFKSMKRDASTHHVTTPMLSSPFLNPSIAPHAIHALFLSSTLLFAAHTQIVLRLAASMPFTYWAAAWLYVEHPAWGKRWVAWSVVWGAISIVLWATFLPPA